MKEDCLLKAGNTLTQRSFRVVLNRVVVKIDLTNMAEGQHAGLCHFAEHSGCLGVIHDGKDIKLEFRHDDRPEIGPKITSEILWLESIWGLDGKSTFLYSTDGENYTKFADYNLSWGFYRGDRIGIYSYNNLADKGFIDVDYLHYDMIRQ